MNKLYVSALVLCFGFFIYGYGAQSVGMMIRKGASRVAAQRSNGLAISGQERSRELLHRSPSDFRLYMQEASDLDGLDGKKVLSAANSVAALGCVGIAVGLDGHLLPEALALSYAATSIALLKKTRLLKCFAILANYAKFCGSTCFLGAGIGFSCGGLVLNEIETLGAGLGFLCVAGVQGSLSWVTLDKLHEGSSEQEQGASRVQLPDDE